VCTRRKKHAIHADSYTISSDNFSLKNRAILDHKSLLNSLLADVATAGDKGSVKYTGQEYKGISVNEKQNYLLSLLLCVQLSQMQSKQSKGDNQKDWHTVVVTLDRLCFILYLLLNVFNLVFVFPWPN